MKVGATAIRLLGTLSIGRAGVPSAAGFSGRRSELVFAYLAAEHRRDVSRDELADALWPQELPDAWAAALRSVVSDVRRVIAAGGLDAADVLERTGAGYRLRLPPDAVLDLDEARSALAISRVRLEEDPARAAADAERAAELARLPFLPHHEGDWVDGVRRDLERILVEALEVSAGAHARAGDSRAASAAAARLLEVEPYNDAAHRLRIELLAAAGDRAGAVRAFDECRTTLAEAGVEPSAETRAALQRALETTSEAGPAGAPPGAAAQAQAALSVLVVDDHDFQRRTALALLRRLGVGSLTEAQDGAGALELLAGSPPPDVIVCDIDMPGMDGVEFIRHVAERRLASAVIIASGLDRSVLHAVEAVAEGYGLQVLGVVEKPLTARRLSELLADYQRPLSPDAGSEAAAVTDAEVRAALKADRISARFLPVVDLQDGAISSAALVPTWKQHKGAPSRIVLEDLSAAVAAGLTDRLLAIACDQLRTLSEADVDIVLSVPMAREALADVSRADRLTAMVRDREADPRRLVWLVGERAVRRSTPGELDVLTRLRVKGFGVCLDGFEGGHASDDALRRIPLTAVALAPALVRGAAGDRERTGALEKALESVRAHGLPAVARGCDDAADYDLLLQIGCRHAQGEFIGAALPAREFAGWARRWHAPSIADDPR